MNFILKYRALTIRIIGFIQIIGGITGLYLVASLLMYTEAINGPNLLIFLIGLSLFVFSFNCGKALLFDTNKKEGMIKSIINYSLQVIQWKLLGYGLSYSTGIDLSLGIKNLSLSFNFSIISSSFSMVLNADSYFLIRINLAAIIMILILLKLYRNSPRPEDMIIKESQINVGQTEV